MENPNETFLDEIAQYLLSDTKAMRNTWVILPSQRAISFLKKSLIEQSSGALFLPEMMTIDKVLDKFYEVKKLDGLTALFELFLVYQKTVKEPQDFDEFLSWGRTALADFNAVDRYLVDPKELFGFLNDAKAIELWNLNNEPLTKNEEEYLKFWESFGELYYDFKAHCNENSIATSGQQIRSIVENPEEIPSKLQGVNQVIIGGLNALSNAETELIKRLKKEIKTELFWDADAYYLQSNIEEAGTFIRRNIQILGKSKWNKIEERIVRPKEINITFCATSFGQTKAVHDILQKEYPNVDPTSTAVILNEQELLMPMLYQIPSNVDKANITMGYPVKLTPLSSFVQMILDAWRGAKSSSSSSVYYHKNVFGLIEHAVLQPFLEEDQFKAFKAQMQRFNKVYIGSKSIFEHFPNDIFKDIFCQQPPEGIDILKQLLNIFSRLKSNFEKETERLETQLMMEYLYHFTISINSLYQRFLKYNVSLPITGIKNLLLQEINKQSIDFFGEPLSGLQIMGVLETRAIDFEHVIITSVNEGIMPKGKFQNSFIPYEIARQFGLPGYKEQDAIYAYYFYRLLQRSKKVDILYHNSKDTLSSSGEESRFILQIQKAFEQNKRITIKKYHYAPDAKKEGTETKIEKSEEVLDKIRQYLQKKVSPSAINTYLSCPLDFYNLYILGLREEDELEEEIDASTFGTIVHNTLEELFKPFINREISEKEVASFSEKYQKLLNEQFIKYFGEIENIQTGPNRLHYEAAKNYIEAYIKFEIEQIRPVKTEIVNLEEILEKEIELEIHGKPTKIRLYGKADRIAKINGVVQILDYKTGSVESTDLSIIEKNILEGGKNIKGKALQIMIYAYLYLLTHPETSEIEAHIYSFKKKSLGFQPLKINYKTADKASILEITPRILVHIFEALLDPKELIEHNSKSEYCTYCLN